MVTQKEFLFVIISEFGIGAFFELEQAEEEIDEVMENYRLKDTFLQELGASFYAQAVALVNAKVSDASNCQACC